MKKTLLTAIALVGFIYVGTGSAEDAKPTPQSHEEHHPGANATAVQPTEAAVAPGNMMDKMDMGKMQGMMHECMQMHNDGKMCDHNMMDKCQEKMGKGECHKMMKQAKANGKKTSKKTTE